jgi:hypothetical protein
VLVLVEEGLDLIINHHLIRYMLFESPSMKFMLWNLRTSREDLEAMY